MSRTRRHADVDLEKAAPYSVAFRSRRRCTSHSQPQTVHNPGLPERAEHALFGQGEKLLRGFRAIWHWGVVSDALSPRGRHMDRGRRRAVVGLRVLCKGVVLVGLHCSLACACRAEVGPFIRDYETERYEYM
ncbi:hypothetical protein Taro_045310 [Colocasia esculenta]|uniref:Uncharacterized protein n=1 Tax=Colocasia esculenta TaxID=4460 RepID=A0A843WLN8_COLES|nr:hypothetical protein [Colocasia esculenta]